MFRYECRLLVIVKVFTRTIARLKKEMELETVCVGSSKFAAIAVMDAIGAYIRVLYIQAL